MATPFLPGVMVLPVRNDSGAAKRARDGDLLFFSEEADARGWSSSIPERSLALRRRRGPAFGSSTGGCGWITAAAAATADELGCRCEEAVTPDAVGAVTAAEETEMVDPSCIAYFCCRDLAAFVPPPMATALLPPSAFVTDIDGGIIILEAKNDDDDVVAAAADTTDEHGCRLEEAATPDAVGSGPTAAEETAMVDPYFSYFCLTFL